MISVLCLTAVTMFSASGCQKARQEETFSSGRQTTDLISINEHEEITWDLIQIVEHDPSLKKLLEKSIEQAKTMNPDVMTNPVTDLDSYYAFIDRCVHAMGDRSDRGV